VRANIRDNAANFACHLAWYHGMRRSALDAPRIAFGHYIALVFGRDGQLGGGLGCADALRVDEQERRADFL
jgi:hypothetical protein